MALDKIWNCENQSKLLGAETRASGLLMASSEGCAAPGFAMASSHQSAPWFVVSVQGGVCEGSGEMKRTFSKKQKQKSRGFIVVYWGGVRREQAAAKRNKH